jgi:hypothetical protein
MPDLKSKPEELFNYAMQGDRTNERRVNFQEAVAILQFQLLIQQKKTVRWQMYAAIGTFLLFLATIGLIVATAG